MAKKAAKVEARTVASLTKAEVAELAKTLTNTNFNVFTFLKGKYGVEGGDAIFDRLEKEAGLFKCEECNRWMDTEEKDGAFVGADVCTSCADAMNDEDEDDE